MSSVGCKSKWPCKQSCTGDSWDGLVACCTWDDGAAADSGDSLAIVAESCNESFLDAV